MVLTMLSKGMTVQDIAEISGLPVEEVEQLRDEN